MEKNERYAICKSLISTVIEGISGEPFLTIENKDSTEENRFPTPNQDLAEILCEILSDKCNINKISKVNINLLKDGKITLLNRVDIF